jgi:hypothetical protein
LPISAALNTNEMRSNYKSWTCYLIASSLSYDKRSWQTWDIFNQKCFLHKPRFLYQISLPKLTRSIIINVIICRSNQIYACLINIHTVQLYILFRSIVVTSYMFVCPYQTDNSWIVFDDQYTEGHLIVVCRHGSGLHILVFLKVIWEHPWRQTTIKWPSVYWSSNTIQELSWINRYTV